MSPEAWGAVAAVLSAFAAAASGVAIARINATKKSADSARDYSEPTGNGYAQESREAWARIESTLTQLSERQVRTNGWLMRHLADHAQHDIASTHAHPDLGGTEDVH